MSEIDIFLELLDNKRLYYICRTMKIAVQGKNNKELNKIKLRQRFKSGSKSFNSFIMQNLDENISELTENEYLIFLRYIDSTIYSNDKKFINLLGYFPNKAQELLEYISENLNSDRDLYDFNILFNDSDVENLLNKTFEFLDKKHIEDYIDSILKLIVKDEIINSSEIQSIDINEIEKYTLDDLFKGMENISKEKDLFSKYFYIKSHEIDEPLYSHLLLNIYNLLLTILAPSIKRIKYIKNTENLIVENDKFKNDNNQLQRQLKKYKNKEKDLEKGIEENNKLKHTIDNKKRQISDYKEQIKDLKLDYKNIIEDNNLIKKELNKYKKQINNVSIYFEDFNSDLSNVDILVITSFDIGLLKILYGNEVIFLSSKQLNEDKLLQLSKTVNTILIERTDISSQIIMAIRQQFLNQDVIVTIINPKNSKELLEKIIIVKDKIRRKI